MAEIRRERRDDGTVWYRADEPAPDGRSYNVQLILVCPEHKAEMLLHGTGPRCYCPIGGCTVEVLVYLKRRE